MTAYVGIEYLRRCAQVSQAQMAEAMGLPLRTYEDIEAGRSNYRPVHQKAAELALMNIAAEKGDPLLLTLRLRETVLKLATAINNGNEKPAS